MKKFIDYKEGEYIWYMYNINWDKNLPVEYKLEKCLIKVNNLNTPIKRNINTSPWEDSEYIIDYEHYIEVDCNGKIYSRYYNDNYDEYKIMRLCPGGNIDYYGPDITLYPTYEIAKEDLISQCNLGINTINEQIKELEFKKSLYIKSLEQVK